VPWIQRRSKWKQHEDGEAEEGQVEGHTVAEAEGDGLAAPALPRLKSHWQVE
jgi:hypothetical protein